MVFGVYYTILENKSDHSTFAKRALHRWDNVEQTVQNTHPDALRSHTLQTRITGVLTRLTYQSRNNF